MAVSVKEVRVTGPDALALATSLLQRARLAEPLAGMWEAADVQWWWRKPQQSDEIDQLFWLDDDGPVAGVLLTSSADDSWQCDPVVVPGAWGHGPDDVWVERWNMLRSTRRRVSTFPSVTTTSL